MNTGYHLISMAGEAAPALRSVRPALRLGAQDPHLRLDQVTMFVADHQRSLRFYVDRLGFDVIADRSFPDGARVVTVAPPDGTASLVLLSPQPGSEHYKHIGQTRQIILLTDDVYGKYHKWRGRGVLFHHAPIKPAWGGLFTAFEDPDGNSFVLVGFDEATREVEELRRRATEVLERERRATYEIELAREVQRKLLPRSQPFLSRLDYACECLPARVIGGDYYDFLKLAPGQVGFVLADVAGKGLPAAHLMANLQAILRSQARLGLQDPAGLLRSVNRLFYENTEPDRYATLFFGRYDDVEGKLSYVNCGHNPPLLVHSNGEVDLLNSTATVLGFVSEWDCAVAEAQLLADDVLVMYTDGITEAKNGDGEEFGVGRLVDAVRSNAGLPASVVVSHTVSAVKNLGADKQEDDITLVVGIRR